MTLAEGIRLSRRVVDGRRPLVCVSERSFLSDWFVLLFLLLGTLLLGVDIWGHQGLLSLVYCFIWGENDYRILGIVQQVVNILSHPLVVAFDLPGDISSVVGESNLYTLLIVVFQLFDVFDQQ